MCGRGVLPRPRALVDCDAPRVRVDLNTSRRSPMSRRVRVHHFVANLTTRQYGPHPTSDLLGVDYIHDVPADAEFPRTILRMDLFTRFYLEQARPCEFFAQVWWIDHPSGTPEMLGQ